MYWRIERLMWERCGGGVVQRVVEVEQPGPLGTPIKRT